MADNLNRFLAPRSVAVIGGTWGREVIKQCRRANYTGALWCVNSKLNSVDDIPCYRTVADLPAAPDAAFIAVNRHDSIGVIKALAERGCGGAICFAAGFREAGKDDLEQQLLAAAGDMPFLGPNCYGYINYLCNTPLWPDQHGGEPVTNGVAIISQSGNMGINLTMQKRGLPLAFMCAIGNQTKVGFATLTRALLDNPAITAIGWVMEGVDNAAALEQTMRQAHGKKPVVVLKLGATEQGAATALSHTASLAGDDAAAGAFFRHHGIARVNTLPAFLETLKFLHFCGVLRGRRVASLSCSGGEAALVADRLGDRRLALPDFSATEKTRIGQVIGGLVVVQNPFDYHTFVWGDYPAMQAVYEAVLSCAYDVSLLVLDIPRADRCINASYRPVADSFFAASQATNNGNVAALVSSLSDNMPEDLVRTAAAAGVCCFAGLEEALDAVCAAADIGEAWQDPLPPPLCRRTQPPTAAAVQIADEHTSKQLIAAAGVSVPRGIVANSPAEAKKAAESLALPVVVKALGIAHKSDCGGVHLHCNSGEAAEQAANDMRHLSDSFLIEEMVTDSVAELIIGVKYDDTAGLIMLIGAGGIWAEVLRDVAVVLLPTDAQTLKHALSSLRAAPMWRGGRGAAVADEEGTIRSLLKIAAFAEQSVNNLLELDINPLLLRKNGDAIAADVLLVR